MVRAGPLWASPYAVEAWIAEALFGFPVRPNGSRVPEYSETPQNPREALPSPRRYVRMLYLDDPKLKGNVLGGAFRPRVARSRGDARIQAC